MGVGYFMFSIDQKLFKKYKKKKSIDKLLAILAFPKNNKELKFKEHAVIRVLDLDKSLADISDYLSQLNFNNSSYYLNSFERNSITADVSSAVILYDEIQEILTKLNSSHSMLPNLKMSFMSLEQKKN